MLKIDKNSCICNNNRPCDSCFKDDEDGCKWCLRHSEYVAKLIENEIKASGWIEENIGLWIHDKITGYIDTNTAYVAYFDNFKEGILRGDDGRHFSTVEEFKKFMKEVLK